jgi:hypothetical protein
MGPDLVPFLGQVIPTKRWTLRVFHLSWQVQHLIDRALRRQSRPVGPFIRIALAIADKQRLRLVNSVTAEHYLLLGPSNSKSHSWLA